MSLVPDPPSLALPARLLLDALPIAAALVTGGREPNRSPAMVAANAAWRHLWQDADPGTDEDLFIGGAAFAVVADHAEIIARIGDHLPCDRLVAVEGDGPAVVRLRGRSLDHLYLLTAEASSDPKALATAWPAVHALPAPPRVFHYFAGLDPDGRWRIRSSRPAFHEVLNLAETVEGWLHLAARADRPALRSRNLELLRGRMQAAVYRLRRPAGGGVTVQDTAVPARHPSTGEIVGLHGLALVVDPPTDGRPAEAIETAAAAAPACPGDTLSAKALIEALDGLGMPSILLDARAQVVACAESVGAVLGQAEGPFVGRPVRTLPLPDGEAIEAFVLAGTGPATGARLEVPRTGEAGTARRFVVQRLPIGEAPCFLVVPAGAGSDGRLLRDALYHDPATGLANRFLFLDRLRQAVVRAALESSGLTVMVLAIERPRSLERPSGKGTLDALLQALVRRLEQAIGGLDTLARLDGNRLAVLVVGREGADGVAKLAQALLGKLQEPVEAAGRKIAVAGRVGIAVFPQDGDTAEALLRNAQEALGRLPAESGHGFQFFDNAMNALSFDRLMLERQLIEAVERGEFLLHYQPQISFASSRIVGMEALIRWQHPELGMIPPAEFIPIAEETGAIIAIGEWVLEAACRELQAWFEAGIAPLRLAINLSGRQYNNRDLVPHVRRILASTSFPARLLEFELTESVIMEDVVDATRRLGEIDELGISLAVDDFGTGYSSLSYLKRFPIRSLKVDRSFVRDIAHNESSAAITRAIIAFGSALGLKIVAEGVESPEQYQILRGCGCHELQGYLFSRPIRAEEAYKLVLDSRQMTLSGHPAG